ncbi:MAG TPA: tetratricopeptide repeat protein [Kofleriaceae bacterium]|nr:tetratricopeptide repeat protein [Kofleriaceae bacterium]
MGTLQVKLGRPACAMLAVSALIGCREKPSERTPTPPSPTQASSAYDATALRAFEIWERTKDRDDAEAQRLFRDACDRGSQLGCAGLGTTLLSGGTGLTSDPARGVQLLATACDARVARACVSLAKAYEDGLGVERDRVKAAELSRGACDAGEQRGCVQYGRSMLFGDNGVSRDPQRARDLATKACESSIATGCTLAGLAYSSAFADAPESQKWLRRGCDGGDGAGCAALAYQYFNGGLPGEAKGVEISPKLGAEFATRACDLGEQRGCALLARAFANGDGVAQDIARARELAATACNAADAAGCSIAAKIATAEGKTADAATFLERSCALGNAAACKR